MADHVHPTAFGQIAIAERALAVLERDGMTVRTRPTHAGQCPASRRAGGACAATRPTSTATRRSAPARRRPCSGCGSRVGRLERDLAQAGEQPARADELPRGAPALLQRPHDGVAVALEEGVALEQRGAGEVGLGDEPAGGVERRVVVGAARGGRRARVLQWPSCSPPGTQPNQPWAGPS